MIIAVILAKDHKYSLIYYYFYSFLSYYYFYSLLSYYYFYSLLSYLLFKSLAYYSTVLTRIKSNYSISFKVLISPLTLIKIDL